MPIMATKQHDEAEAIFVFFPNDEKVAARTIQEMLGRMKRENVNRAIVVVKKEITNHAARSMNTMRPEFIFDVFHQNDLMVDIMEHVLVPQHVLLPDEEKKILLERYSLKESQLPKIQTRDAVARYLGLEKGQVVKIIRNSETAGRYVTYRFVY
jgi:DNA-directed RNA polymerase I, II, and III subunit RPABC1